MPVRDPFYSTSAWRSLRRRILARDGYECQVRGPGCITWATQVDHIVPRVIDPDLSMDPTNLRAACVPCNTAAGGRLGAARASRSTRAARISRAGGYDAW